jgi:hypothetical protein
MNKPVDPREVSAALSGARFNGMRAEKTQPVDHIGNALAIEAAAAAAPFDVRNGIQFQPVRNDEVKIAQQRAQSRDL